MSKPDMTGAEMALTLDWADRFEPFAAEVLKIQDKRGNVVPLTLNRSQRLREQLLCEIEAAGLPVRVWEAKARQLGCSTHIQGRMCWRCFTRCDESALVAAHADPAARKVFAKAKFFLDQLPDTLRPRQKYNNRQELDLREARGPGGLRSTFEVMTAKSVEDARGMTARQVHISEVAFFTRPERFFTATLQAIPDEPGTMIYVESTCNGSGDYHHTQYLSARLWWDDPPPWMPLKRDFPGDPNSKWIALFTPWYLLDEYRSPLPEGITPEAFRATLDVEESNLLAVFEEFVTLEHLQWRRETIVSKCGGSVQRFHQEYPSTDAEAFAASGSPAFDSNDLARMTEQHGCHCETCLPYPGAAVPAGNDCPPHAWYDLVDVGPSNGGDLGFRSYRPELVPVAPGGGPLSVWQEPLPGRRYLISIDISKGAVGSDWDHLFVLDTHDGGQVAEWRGKVELPLLTDVAILLGLHYNLATLAPETTGGFGAALIAMLERARYPMLYRRVVPDQIGGPTTQLGWDTNRRTKPTMIALLQQALREGNCTIRSAVVLDELRIYRKSLTAPDGDGPVQAEWGAPVGRHDDGAVAAMIAVAVAQYLPRGPLGRSGRSTRRPLREALDSSQYTEEDWERMEARNRGRGTVIGMLNGRRRL